MSQIHSLSLAQSPYSQSYTSSQQNGAKKSSASRVWYVHVFSIQLPHTATATYNIITKYLLHSDPTVTLMAFTSVHSKDGRTATRTDINTKCCSRSFFRFWKPNQYYWTSPDKPCEKKYIENCAVEVLNGTNQIPRHGK